MENLPNNEVQIEYNGFTEAHVWGARIVLHKLMTESREGWNSFGFRLWIEKELRELETIEDELASDSRKI